MSTTILIAVPAQDQCATLFAYDLARLVGHTAHHRPDLGIRFAVNKGTLIANQRHTLASMALQDPAVTHILWLDSDMRFPKDALLRLLAHDKPIVAADYARRRPPIWGVSFKDGGNLVIAAGASGLIPVAHTGMGLMLTQRSVFERIERPWFAIGYNPSGDGHYIGEDVFLCKKAHDAGIEVLVDAALSQETQHLGEFAYTHAAIMQTLEMHRAPAGPEDE
jgi:hypothetical protein